ncbi:MAG: Gfo/Idh/MocA family oxidoreductase [Deltaproteobacteria bacterium]|nr:Gfo/Idh/MocA family oxidoreductase [Deltaproteobacteria bacterium]
MIRLVFLGCGKIARAHAKRLRRHRADVEVGFASRDAAKAQAFATELGGRAFGSYAEAMASPDVDAVAVVTPPSSHTELALAALAAGKHVVLEKPPAATASDIDRIAAAARTAGKQVFVAENYRYKPLLFRLRSLLAEGVIGDVLFIQVNAIKKQESTHDWRDDPDVALGGALYEGGIHWIDFMANLGLTVRSARGLRPALPAGASVERSMLVSFDYAEGAVGTLAYSWEVPSTAKGLRLSKIYGRAGSITFETNGLWVLCHGKKTRFYVPGLRDLAGYRAMWADFVRAWTTSSEPLMTLAQARRDLELVEAAYATAAEVS